jgi:choline dehydrogenase-like flavoprotein
MSLNIVNFRTRPVTALTYDAIVIGTGPGGAMVAKELAHNHQRVLILEQGSAAPLAGTLGQLASIAAIPGRGAFFNFDGSLLVRGVTVGGSSAINFATAMPPPLDLFDRHGVDLRAALSAVRHAIPMAPLPDSLIGPMAHRIMQGARSLGLNWQKLDKMIFANQCRTGCWRCAYGCPFGAKWTAKNLIDEALVARATLLDQATARRIILDNGHAVGVAFKRGGQLQQAYANKIILAGGGVGSPRLLKASGLISGKQAHFSDPVITVMGQVDDVRGGAEVPMAAGIHFEEDGIILSDLTLPRPMYQAFAAQVGRVDRLRAHAQTLSIMVKIRDEIGGNIGRRWINKRLQTSDRQKIKQSISQAKAILNEVGARKIFKSWHFAAHPGGSVRIGESVDSNLCTSAKNLFVCDASVIPEAWGLPPTVTILCLGKRLADYLISIER